MVEEIKQSWIDVGEVHGFIGTISWLVLVHLGLWSNYFKHTRYGTTVHGIVMTIVILAMVGTSMLIIGEHGIQRILNTSHQFHNYFGLFILLNCPLILISGTLCKFSQIDRKSSPKTIQQYNFRHSCYGWAMIALSKIPLYTRRHESAFLIFLIVMFDLVSTSVFLYLKFYGNHRNPKQIDNIYQQSQKLQLKTFKNQKQLKQTHKNYFIFEQMIYDIHNVLGTHPGGWKLIEEIQGRQADRFIYGVQPIEKYSQTKAHPHSSRSISLSDNPIGNIQIGPQIFKNMQLCNYARVSAVDKINNYIYKLVLTLPNLQYRGYLSIQSLGKYYAVSFQNSVVTRLYTMVNFLQPRHHQLHSYLLDEKNTNQQMTEQKLQIENHNNLSESCIPLMIKKYNDGRFTSNLLQEQNFKKQFNLMISCPRGLGLGLSQLAPSGNIVMMAAGTGVYPFSDTIDLLYKSILVKNNHRLKQILLQNDPVLKQQPFQKFTFTLYLSVNYFAQIHPLTITQCNQLASTQIFKCFLKTKASNKQVVKQKYPHIQLIDQNFQAIVKNKICPQISTTSKILMCGPSRFTKAILQAIQECQINYTKVTIV